MSVVEVKPTDDVLCVAEDGTPVTGNMILGWCEAYDRGELPNGYEVDGVVSRGRPPLHGERMATMTIRLPHSQKVALEREAKERGVPTSTYVRRILTLRSA